MRFLIALNWVQSHRIASYFWLIVLSLLSFHLLPSRSHFVPLSVHASWKRRSLATKWRFRQRSISVRFIYFPTAGTSQTFWATRARALSSPSLQPSSLPLFFVVTAIVTVPCLTWFIAWEGADQTKKGGRAGIQKGYYVFYLQGKHKHRFPSSS